MNREDAWKNFDLGQEISVSGAFIYNGLRRFHEMRSLDHTDEIFEFLYDLAVGLERLLKVAVVLLEHDTSVDQSSLERSLITHEHLGLLHRVRTRATITLGPPHNEFLQLLSHFYRTLRYGRFSLGASVAIKGEQRALCRFLEKHLDVDLDPGDSIFGVRNENRFRRFMAKIVQKIAKSLYEAISDRASHLNLYTYEVRYGSRAYTVFLGNFEVASEDVLWKELLLFFMHTKYDKGVIGFMKSLKPLFFDPGLATDYLNCFRSDVSKSEVMDELEHLYEELPNRKERLEQMKVIGNPSVSFPDEDEELDEEHLDEEGHGE